MLNIGLIQMRCEKGALAENLASISRYLAEADDHNIDILAFPEMSFTGYNDPTRYPHATLRLDGPEMDALCAITRGHAPSVLVGVIEENPEGKPFITQVALRDGLLTGYYRKRTVIDDEAAWFTPGQAVPIFTHGPLTYGISICADIGNESVFAECAQQGAQIVFELAAPGLYGEQATRNWASGFAWWEGLCQEKLSLYAQKYHLWIAVATQAGRTVDEDFPGGAFIFDPTGQRLYATPDGQPGAVYLSLDLENGQWSVL